MARRRRYYPNPYSLSTVHATRAMFDPIASGLPDFEPLPDLEFSVRPLPRLFSTLPAVQSPLREIEDRRTLRRSMPALTSGSRRARLRARGWGVQFSAPRFTLVCVRRKQRREVIFARGRAGRGVPRRRPRFNYYSRVSC